MAHLLCFVIAYVLFGSWAFLTCKFCKEIVILFISVAQFVNTGLSCFVRVIYLKAESVVIFFSCPSFKCIVLPFV